MERLVVAPNLGSTFSYEGRGSVSKDSFVASHAQSKLQIPYNPFAEFLERPTGCQLQYRTVISKSPSCLKVYLQVGGSNGSH
eukprot:gene2884-5661_t